MILFGFLSFLTFILFGCVSSEDYDKLNQQNLELQQQKSLLETELNSTKSQLQTTTADLNNKTSENKELNDNITKMTDLLSKYQLAYDARQIANENLSELLALSKQLDTANTVLLSTNMSASQSDCQKWVNANVERQGLMIQSDQISIAQNTKLLTLYKTKLCRDPLQKIITLTQNLDSLRSGYIQIQDKDNYCRNFFDPYYNLQLWNDNYVTPSNNNVNEINAVITQINQYTYDAQQFCSLE